jgi:hypothetical protein
VTTLMTLHGIVADEGTVVLFSGLHNEWGRPMAVRAAVDCAWPSPSLMPSLGAFTRSLRSRASRSLGRRIRASEGSVTL